MIVLADDIIKFLITADAETIICGDHRPTLRTLQIFTISPKQLRIFR